LIDDAHGLEDRKGIAHLHDGRDLTSGGDRPAPPKDSVLFPERKAVLCGQLQRGLRPISHDRRIAEMLMKPAVQMQDVTESIGVA
jgi:hypothetical protein